MDPALLCEVRGNTGQARALLEDAWELAAPLRFCLSYRFLGPDLIRLAVEAGDYERAAAVADEVADGARRCGVSGATAVLPAVSAPVTLEPQRRATRRIRGRCG